MTTTLGLLAGACVMTGNHWQGVVIFIGALLRAVREAED